MKGKSKRINPSVYSSTKVVPIGTLAKRTNLNGKDYFALGLNGSTDVLIVPRSVIEDGRKELLLDLYFAQPDPNAPPQDVLLESFHAHR